MSKINVLVVGSGGREHALVRACKASPMVAWVHCTPGNAGIAYDAQCHQIADTDIKGVVELAKRIDADLVVIGPETPLVAGMGNALRREGFKVFGPNAGAARLEGSKSYAKEIMRAAGVPTADSAVFTSFAAAKEDLDYFDFPVVIKLDGLASGKGVTIVKTRTEAETILKQNMLNECWEDTGTKILIEECLAGQECSILALCDGETVLPLEPAQDYKRIFDGDEGPNTGGMGCYSPVPHVPPNMVTEIIETVHKPVIAEMAKRGHRFCGILYAGLMITPEGPKVLEFNVRFGDPETQVILPRLESDLVEVMLACAEGNLAGHELEWKNESAVTVILASDGYPASSSKGDVISGLNYLYGGVEEAEVFHAGTARDGNGSLVTNGGRVLAVTALGWSILNARTKAYQAAEGISFLGMQMRTDIAKLPAEINIPQR